MTKEKVYIETSVISYLTARPTRDIVKLAKQQLTREWWESRCRYDLYVSTPVLKEIRNGDPGAAQLRMDSVAGLPEIAANDGVSILHEKLLSSGSVPAKATTDAFHIALAAVHAMTFLLTWNCTHINNTATRQKIAETIAEAGYTQVMVATPEELLRR